QYNSGYSSLIESFEKQDLEAISQRKRERAELLKTASFSERTAIKLKEVPWKKYFIFGIIGPFFPAIVVLAAMTISVQGLQSKVRTNYTADSHEDLDRMRDEAVITRTSTSLDEGSNESSKHSISTPHPQEQQEDQHGQPQDQGQIYQGVSTDTVAYIEPIQQRSQADSSITSPTRIEPCNDAITDAITERNNVPVPSASVATPSNIETSAGISSEPGLTTSLSYPNMKLQPLALLPVQIEISKNLNRLKWKKNIIHITSMNAHASIIMREKLLSNDGGIAAVQHAVDMFKDEGEDE
ncbi:hypothetical protein BGX26_008415, partial [Mortierella sp. AD094]